MKKCVYKIVLLLAIYMSFGVAYAAEQAGVELGAAEGNTITMVQETVRFTFPDALSGEPGDELTAHTVAKYTLYNSYGEDKYTAIAEVRTLKVKEVTVTSEERENFKSGASILVDGRENGGYIYPIGTVDKMTQTLAYNSGHEMLLNTDYSGYFSEAFAKYGVFSFEQYREEKFHDIINPLNNNDEDFYVVSDDGEERLCVIVYNLRFDSLEKKEVEISRDIRGVMKRPIKDSTLGTTFEFYYGGNNLKTFYSVKDTEMTFKFPTSKKLGLLKFTAPYYDNDGVCTVRYTGAYSPFEFKLGEELSKEELDDLWARSGSGRILLEVLQGIATVLLGMSIVYIAYTVKKRRQSGLETEEKRYF